MSWTAPEVTRTEPPFVAAERPMLEGWLDFHRQTLRQKCAGLTDRQLKQRAVPPSSLSLLGLVRHLTDVERTWFRVRFAGEALPELYDYGADVDADLNGVEDADAAAALVAFDEEIGAVRRAVAGAALDATFVHPRTGTVRSLRWMFLHMIEEYARHNGHADLLRERIDGVTGE